MKVAMYPSFDWDIPINEVEKLKTTNKVSIQKLVYACFSTIQSLEIFLTSEFVHILKQICLNTTETFLYATFHFG